MTAHYRVLPAADRDLDDQASYLAAVGSLELALRFYDAASATFATIAGMPAVGERWRSDNPRLAELRVWPVAGFEKHLIFYRPVVEGIEIVRVVHGPRDIDGVLESGHTE